MPGDDAPLVPVKTEKKQVCLRQFMNPPSGQTPGAVAVSANRVSAAPPGAGVSESTRPPFAKRVKLEQHDDCPQDPAAVSSTTTSVDAVDPLSIDRNTILAKARARLLSLSASSQPSVAPSVASSSNTALAATPNTSPADTPREELHVAVEAGDGDAAAGGGQLDKKQLNNIADYMRRKAPPEEKTEYEEMRKLGTKDPRRRAWMLSMHAKISTAGVTSTTTIKQKKTDTDGGSLLSWEQFKTAEGEIGAMSMIRRKKIHMQDHPGLIDDPAIPWPQNQQFAYETKSWSTSTEQMNEQKLESKPVSDDEAISEFRRMSDELSDGGIGTTPVGVSNSPPVPPQYAALGPPAVASDELKGDQHAEKDIEKDKQTVADKVALFRRTHNELERGNRNMTSVIAKSQNASTHRGANSRRI